VNRALAAVLSVTPEQVAALPERDRAEYEALLQREIVLQSPAHFATALSGGAWVPYHHLVYTSERITAMVDDDACDCLIVEQPVRHGKTLLCSRWTPAWFVIRYRRPVLLASYEGDFAATHGGAARTIVETHGPRFGVRIDPSSNAKHRWEILGAEAGMQCAGAGGSITGKGGALQVIDDPLKNREQADSATERDKQWDWWESVWLPRREPGAKFLIVMSRWHTDDLVGRLIVHPGALRIERIRLPAIAEDDEPDPLGRAPGQALCPERYDEVALAGFRADVGPQAWCTPAESPVLMGDWTERPISKVAVGDEVIGFTVRPRVAPRVRDDFQRSALVPATVSAINETEADVWEYQLESGRIVRCTSNHHWYAGRGGWERTPQGYPTMRPYYRPPTIGGELVVVDEHAGHVPTEREATLWWYLAGIIDGEGSIADSSCPITQGIDQHPPSKRWVQRGNGPVCDRIAAVLDELGISYNVRERPGSQWSGQRVLVIRDVRGVYRRLLRYAEPGKAAQIIEALWRRPHMWGRGRDRIMSGRLVGHQPVYALTTSTGNYVVWGYASSNSSLYQQRPTPVGGGKFRRSQFRYWSAETVNDVTWYRLGDQLVDSRDCWRFATMDPAFTRTKASDFTVMAIWAVAPTDPASLILLERRRQRVEAAEHGPMVRAMWDQWHPAWVGIERQSATLVLFADAQRAGVVIRELRPDRNKVARAETAVAIMEQGRVYFPRAAPWLADWENELLEFPVGAHDDQVDVLAYAAGELARATVRPRRHHPHPVTREERCWAALEAREKARGYHPILGAMPR
jgi:predicted phage terminase large subunit-like protein